VSIIEDTLLQPNGIALSPDKSTVYISDTGANAAPVSQNASTQAATTFAPTNRGRTIYAFNVSADATYLFNKRPIYLAQDWIPDGLKVAQNGLVVAGTGRGVDVLDSSGTLILRVQTNYTVQNFAWAGKDLTDLWIFGQGGVSRVSGWGLKGQDLSAAST
jgi:sugar lactone lactonase YvrE